MLASIEVRVSDDGPESEALIVRTRAIVERIAPGFEVRIIRATGAPLTPSVHINGQPLRSPLSLSRQAEATGIDAGDGSGTDPPPEWLIEASVVASLEPRHLLFMCVANSARSQMAEGMARALAPRGVTISSAGSEPAFVRPEAITVMKEIGIDIEDQYSKALDRVEVDSVQVVVTLCAEEVCPAFLKPVPRLHWPIPDPAAIEGDGETQLAAFREARDAIRDRLYVLFHG